MAEWVQSYVDEHWEASWQEQLPRVEAAYDRVGEPAYGVYSRGLFRPIEDELMRAQLECDPILPGTFELSEERGGPLRNRERRLWSVVKAEDGPDLGALLTCFFHDHTRLRLPRSPVVLALEQTDHRAIRRIAARRM